MHSKVGVPKNCCSYCPNWITLALNKSKETDIQVKIKFVQKYSPPVGSLDVMRMMSVHGLSMKYHEYKYEPDGWNIVLNTSFSKS